MLQLFVVAVVAWVSAAQLYPVPSYPTFVPTDSNTPLYPNVPLSVIRKPFTPIDPKKEERIATKPDGVDLVIVGVTSGNRNPDVFLRDDPNVGQWGEEGEGILNTIGKREALRLGRSLRERYSDILTEQFYPTNFAAYSSTGESETMTSQIVNAGLFPPVGRAIFDPSIQWQPVPVTTEDHLLGMPRVDRCPTVKEALKPIFTGQIPEIRDVLEREKVIVEYVVRSTGIRRNIQDLSEVAENLRQLKLRNLPFPQWAENPTIENLDRDTLYERIQIFRNAVEVACSVYEPCRKIVSGVLLSHIVETIRQNVKVRQNDNIQTHEPRKNKLGMVVYTGDIEVILSVFRVLKLDYFNIPTTGGFILEVKTRDQVPTIRVLVHKPDPMYLERTRYVIPQRVAGTTTDCKEEFCTIDQFISTVKPDLIPDYRVACDDFSCLKEKTSANDKDVVPVSPKIISKNVDCTVAVDKYPERACKELALTDFCLRHNFVRNVVCRRTCHCIQFETVINEEVETFH